MKCGIRHKFSDATCIREPLHDGLCRSRAERMGGGNVTYAEWESRCGIFVRHVRYKTIYPANARRPWGAKDD